MGSDSCQWTLYIRFNSDENSYSFYKLWRF